MSSQPSGAQDGVGGDGGAGDVGQAEMEVQEREEKPRVVGKGLRLAPRNNARGEAGASPFAVRFWVVGSLPRRGELTVCCDPSSVLLDV